MYKKHTQVIRRYTVAPPAYHANGYIIIRIFTGYNTALHN